MKKLFIQGLSKGLLFAASIGMVACTDEMEELKSDVVAQEAETTENGFIKGSLSGTRKDDGKAIEEMFDFKHTYSNKVAFDMREDGKTEGLNLSWSEQNNYDGDGDFARINISIENKGTATEKVNIDYFNCLYTTPVAERTLFTLQATSHFEETELVFPVSPTNTDYSFVFSFPYNDQRGFIHEYNEEMERSYYYIKDTDGNKIYFENAGQNYYYDDATGSYINYGEFVYIIDKEGGKSFTSEKYGALTVRPKEGNSYGWAIFDENGNDLSEIITVKDEQKITNFQYDKTSGLLSFDYEIKLNKYNYYNSSENELTVTGQVEVTVHYDNVISHVPAEKVELSTY